MYHYALLTFCTEHKFLVVIDKLEERPRQQMAVINSKHKWYKCVCLCIWFPEESAAESLKSVCELRLKRSVSETNEDVVAPSKGSYSRRSRRISEFTFSQGTVD